MDDIDKTFEVLRRVSFVELISKIKEYTNGYDGRVPWPDNTIKLHPGLEDFCQRYKWTMEEINKEFNK